MSDESKPTATPATLTELCGVDDATFKRYLELKDNFLQQLDRATQDRIVAAMEKQLSWAV